MYFGAMCEQRRAANGSAKYNARVKRTGMTCRAHRAEATLCSQEQVVFCVCVWKRGESEGGWSGGRNTHVLYLSKSENLK